MPIYEYKCSNDHTFEVMQSMSDDAIEACEVCDSPVERVYHAIAVHFKGSGFHNTDYKQGKNGASGSDQKEEGSKDSDKKSDGSDSKQSKGDSSKSSDASDSSGKSDKTVTK